MSKETRRNNVIKDIVADQANIQRAANVPGMPQFNITRDRVLSLISDAGIEQAARVLADEHQTQELAANAAIDEANHAADVAETARSKAADLEQAAGLAAEAARAQSQDTAHDAAIAAEAARAKAEEARNAAADAAEVARNKAAEALEASTRANEIAAIAAQVASASTADRNRANHTGTQAASTIGDFVEAGQDAVFGVMVDSAEIDVIYDDAGNITSYALMPSGMVAGNYNGINFDSKGRATGGTGLRIDEFTGATTSAGVGKLVFNPPFAVVPKVQNTIAMNGTNTVITFASNITVNGCDVAVWRSKGTLVLSAGPWEAAPISTVFKMLAIGR